MTTDRSGVDENVAHPVPPGNNTRTARALALLGDHWTLLILQHVFRGEHRYRQIRDAIHASDSILANRLKTLTEGGLLVKRPYTDGPHLGRTRHEYHLTSAGRATWRIFIAAWMWERDWVDDFEHGEEDLTHRTCGHPAAPIVVCGKCALPVRARDTTTRLTAPTLTYVGAMPRRHRQARTLAMQADLDHSLTTETMELLGDRWNIALAAAAALGKRRFSDFERFLGIPPTVLSARLGRFVELDVLANQPIPGGNGRSDHRLTRKGRALIPILTQIVRWSDQNLRTAESSIAIIHDACGHKLIPELECGHCHDRLRRRDVYFRLLDG